jgi:topoisomerase-4 subunit A
VKKIVQAEKGFSTLGARHIWYDDTVMRLNTDQRGQYIGAFKEDDKILTLTLSGFYKLMSFDLSNHFEEDMSHIEKFNPSKALTVLYYNELKKASFIKRFIPEFSDKKVCMFPEEDGNKFEKAVTDKRPLIKVEYNNEGAKKPVEPEEIILDEFVEVMGVKAKGKKLSNHPVSMVTWLDPIPVEEEEIEEEIEEDAEEEIDESEDKNDEENEEESIAEIGIKSEESDDTVADEVDWIEESQQTKEPIEQKEQKKPKEPKVPKVPKESKPIKEPKEPKATKAIKEIKEPKAPIPPVNPPDFPEDDDSGTGIQMSLF